MTENFQTGPAFTKLLSILEIITLIVSLNLLKYSINHKTLTFM